MRGDLEGPSVFINDEREASQTYSKGCFGYPLRGGRLELDLVEAVMLCENNRLEVYEDGKKVSYPALFETASREEENFDVRYLVYRDLRARGFIVKPESGAFDLRVYGRGLLPSNSSPVFMVCAVSERSALDISVFLDEVAQSEDRGKQLLYGVVDDEGDITYYKMFKKDPRGSVQPSPDEKVSGKLFGDRVFVFDGGEVLREAGFYGKDDNGILQLSLIEACHLVKTEALSVDSENGVYMSLADLCEFGRATQDEFDLRLKAYEDLRSRGLVVKAGFKYGTHYRVYERSPDKCHAKYLVHAVPASHVSMWPDISRTVRLSGGVKKEILFCRISDGVDYLEFRWFRPRSSVSVQKLDFRYEEDLVSHIAYADHLPVTEHPCPFAYEGGPADRSAVREVGQQRSDCPAVCRTISEAQRVLVLHVLYMVRQERHPV